MRGKRRLQLLGLLALLVVFGATLQGVSQATSGTTTDATGDPTGGTGAVIVDLTSVSHADDANFITYTFATASPVTPAANNGGTIVWQLDSSANSACISLATAGSVFRASLKPGCGPSTSLTADATAGSGNSYSFSFSNAQFRSATGFSGTSYTYTVQSVDANGWTDSVPNSGSITHSGVTAAAPTPSAVLSLAATASCTTSCSTNGNVSAAVSWSAPATGGSTILTYNVQRQVCTPACANQGSAQTVNAPTTTFNDTGLNPNTTYQYVVKATNGTGTGPAATSNQSSFGVPNAPTGVIATAGPGSGQITVSWTAPTNNGGSAITSYQVTANPAPNGGQPAAVTGNPPATQQVVSGLTNGTSYTFTVHATNTAGDSPESAPSSPGVMPANATGTASPQNVTVAVMGVLTIARAAGSPDTINFGTVTKGINPADQDAGGLDYTNTLSDNNAPWNVSVQATNLSRGTGCTLTPASLCTIPYGNMTYKPAQTISADAGSSGTPAASANSAFSGSGSTSLPVSISTAAQGTYGTFHQPDPATTPANRNMLALVVPLSIRPGTYNGVLTYTITG